MDLTIASTANKTGKTLRWHYFSLVCGLALAASAVVAFRGSGNQQPLAPAPRVTMPSFASSMAPTATQTAFYIVADQAQDDEAYAYEALAQWMRYDASVPEANRSVVVLMARNSEEEAHARQLIDEAMAAGNFSDSNPAPRFEIVDLR